MKHIQVRCEVIPSVYFRGKWNTPGVCCKSRSVWIVVYNVCHIVSAETSFLFVAVLQAQQETLKAQTEIFFCCCWMIVSLQFTAKFVIKYCKTNNEPTLDWDVIVVRCLLRIWSYNLYIYIIKNKEFYQRVNVQLWVYILFPCPKKGVSGKDDTLINILSFHLNFSVKYSLDILFFYLILLTM